MFLHVEDERDIIITNPITNLITIFTYLFFFSEATHVIISDTLMFNNCYVKRIYIELNWAQLYIIS